METAEEIMKQTYEKAKAFFKVDLPIYKLNIIKDKAEMHNDEIKTTKWQGAGFFRKNAVFVMDKSFFKDLGYKEDEFEGVIVHELSHIFIKHIVKNFIPIWIEEGLCNHIGFPNMKLKPKEIINLEKVITSEDWYENNTPFVYCTFLFRVLSEDYGNEKILEFIKKLNIKGVKEAFLEVFEISLNDFINKINSNIQNDKFT